MADLSDRGIRGPLRGCSGWIKCMWYGTRCGTNRIVKYDLKGNYLYGWGISGGQPGQFNGPHSITVDQDGNVYLAEVFNGRVQKFRPKPGADKAKVIGQELHYPPKS